ncbi:MAG: leucine--tRNA ligase [bacterium]
MKTKKYDHKKIESKWQKKWDKAKIFKTEKSSKKPKCYVLDMFPYPSGDGLHVGHPKGYIATDIYSRYKKMNGFNILHPMGWDAFGLPAENYAIKNKIHPEVAVKKNIKRFKNQLSKIGFNYDWSREINTTDPEYYKWTQWTFLQMYKKGLAYESYEPINWCPSCQTGLANEDLDGDLCERCGSKVEKKPMRQWVLKITEYADRMLQDLDKLAWPESIKELQRNWIGKSEGTEINFKITNYELGIKVFTTRVDTIFGCTYVVLAPEHPLLQKGKLQITNYELVQKYIDEVKNKPEIERTAEKKEKTGIKLEGVSAINPANGEEVPIFVADYVLGHYGTGAVMAVPAHDERDFAFAKKYNLPIKQVILPIRIDTKNPHREGYPIVERKMVHGLIKNKKTGEYLMLNWKSNPWTTFILGGAEEGEDEMEAILREIKEETGISNLKFLFKSISAYSEYGAYHKQQNRVAYPTAYFFEFNDDSTQVVVTDEEKAKHELQWIDLKKGLPKNFTCSEWDIWLSAMNFEGFSPMTELGKLFNSGKFNGLSSQEAKEKITEYLKSKKFGDKKITYKLKDWVFSRQRYWGEPIPVVHCEKCGIIPVPEKELPVILPKVKSYAPTGTGESPLADIAKWVNTKCPKCKGKAKRETNTMPQWAGSCWYYLRYVDPKNKKALVDKKEEKYFMPVDMYVGGAEHATRHLIYARFWHKFLFDIGAVSYGEPFMNLHSVGLILAEDGKKMSKRWGNVVNPDDMVKTYGADTLRMYEMFMGPFNQAIAWKTDNMIGCRRFIEKIWRIQFKVNKNATIDEELESLLNETIKKVSDSIENFSFNTAISSMMIFSNELDSREFVSRKTYEQILLLLAPFAPHVTDEIWNNLGNKKLIYKSIWPKFDPAKIIKNNFNLVLQINGKVRSTISVPVGITESEAQKIALENEAIKKYTTGAVIKKVIYVKDRLVNIVI